ILNQNEPVPISTAAGQACIALVTECYTPAATSPPTFDTNPIPTAVSGTEITIPINVDKSSTIYYVVDSKRASPLNSDIINGTYGGTAFYSTGSIAASELDDDFATTLNITGLTSGTFYTVYVLAVDAVDTTLESVVEEYDITMPIVPLFDEDTLVTNILTPYKTDAGYGGAREAVELEVDLSRGSDIHYVTLPTTDSAPTAAQVLTKAADTSITLSGVQQNVSARGKFTIDSLDRDTAYTLYSVATFPGDTALASGVQTTALRLVTGTDKLLFDDWARMDDPEDDFVTFYDTTPTISGSANKDSMLFAKLNGELLSGIESPEIPRSPIGTKLCVNLADSCSDYLAHWHITLDADVSDDIQTLEIVSDDDENGLVERSVLKFKVSTPPEKFRTSITPGGESSEKYDFEFSAYTRASTDDMTLLTWNGERYVEYTSGITGTLTYRGRVTNWGDGGGGMAWATLYPDGQMIIMINYGKAGEEGTTLTFDTNNDDVFSGFEIDNTIVAPASGAQADKEISYTWSSHPGAMYKQVWRDDKINNWRDYYDTDIGLTMMLGANNSMDWIMARDLNISLNLKTVVLPASKYYDTTFNFLNADSTQLDQYRAWRQNLTDSTHAKYVKVVEDLAYCNTPLQNSSQCTDTIPDTKLNVIHVVGYGLGGRRDLDSGNFYKMFTNLTRQKAGTGLHELGHTLSLGHCANQRDTMCAGGGFWFGRDGQQRAKQNIASFSQGGNTLITNEVYAAPLPPYSGEDYHRMTAGTNSLVDVLANDIDNNGDTVSIAEVDSETFFGGTAVIEAGKVRYTPPTGFTGLDYFAYKAQSGTVGSNDYFTNTAHATVY
ncbi:MAG: Ig-like domain-containing protein, partial [Glaciecola sp.]|nr:Ig-like domain-containing protein [Glaciecola sp.]